MFILDFIMSRAGAQYTYAGLAIVNALLVFDVILAGWLAKPPRNIVLKSGSINLYLSAHSLKVVAFLLQIYITGANPVYPVAILAPWIRLAWFAVLMFLAPSVLKGTYMIFQAMWQNSRIKVTNVN